MESFRQSSDREGREHSASSSGEGSPPSAVPGSASVSFPLDGIPAGPFGAGDSGRQGTKSSDEMGGEVERLQAEVEHLRRKVEQLGAAREELLEQNRQLRQEATVVRLYKDLARSREEKSAAARSADPPNVAHALYRTLPKTLTVRDFFRHADEEGLGTQATRECFVYFLKEEMLDQSGPRLEKTGRVVHSDSEPDCADRPCTPNYGA